MSTKITKKILILVFISEIILTLYIIKTNFWGLSQSEFIGFGIFILILVIMLIYVIKTKRERF